MSKRFFIIALAGAATVGLVFILKSQWGTSLVWSISNGGQLLLPLVAVAALLDSINPCAFSVLILTIAFLLSIGKLRSKILAVGGTYILGIFLVYLLIGLGLLSTLHIFNTPHFMGRVGAVLLIVLGLINLINDFFPKFPIKLRIPHAAHHTMAVLMDKATFPAAFILGVLVGLCEFPCTGGPYLMVLGLLHDQATYLSGLSYLIFYNALFIIPLLILLFLASDKSLLSKVEVWQSKERKAMRLAGGLLMIALGAVIYFL